MLAQVKTSYRYDVITVQWMSASTGQSVIRWYCLEKEKNLIDFFSEHS